MGIRKFIEDEIKNIIGFKEVEDRKGICYCCKKETDVSGVEGYEICKKCDDEINEEEKAQLEIKVKEPRKQAATELKVNQKRWALDKEKEESKKNNGKRKDFPDSIKHATLKKQDNRCSICHKFTSNPHFDHKDGDRTNNDSINCQALCPNCHDLKSREENRREL